MRISLRAVVATAGIAALAAATSGCGGDSTTADPAATPSEGTTPSTASTEAPVRSDADLVIWTDDLKADAVRSVADGFAEENGISVDVQVVSADLQTNFVTANTAGNGPDVVVGAHDWIGNMVQNGAIDPLQLTPEAVAGYSPIAVDATTYQGQQYGLPYGVESVVLYRNTALAPEEPATLDDAFAAGQAAVDAGEADFPFALPQGELGDAYHMQPMYTSMGGFLFGDTPDGDADPSQLGVGQEGSLAAAQKIYDIGEAGSGMLRRSVSPDNAIALFADGQTPFLVSGPWARADVEAAGVDYEIMPVPGFADGGDAVPFTGVQAFYVASQGENKAFAQEFVTNGVNTEEAMQLMYDGAQLPPALTSLQESIAAEDPVVGTYVQASDEGNPMPAIPQMANVWEPLGQAYAAVVGGADPTQTMEQAASTISAAIS